MKKFLATLLVAMMLVSLCAFQVSADSKVVYVGAGDTWEEKGTGTKADPYSKISMAFKALAATGGEIIIVEDINLVYEYTNDVSEGEPNIPDIGSSAEMAFHFLNPHHAYPITVRSESADDIKKITFAGHRNNTSWSMNGPTTFKNITLDFSNGTYRRFYSNGYDLVFDEGSSSPGTYLYPGISNYATAEDKIARKVTNSSIVLKDGSYGYLFGTQVNNVGDELVTNYYVIGKATVTGYASPGPMNNLTFKEANLYIDTTGSVTNVYYGHGLKNGTVNVYQKSGAVTNYQLQPSTTKEPDAVDIKANINVYGGTVGNVNAPFASALEFTTINVASGVTVPAVSGLTFGTASAAPDFTPKSYVGFAPNADAKATLKTTAEIKPNTDVVFTVEGAKEGGIAIFKKGYDLSFTDTKIDVENGDETTDYDPAFKYPKLDEEGNIKVNDKGEEQYQQYVYGSPLMKGFVVDGKATLNKDSEGVIKSINDGEYAALEGLAVGEYVAYFYAPGASAATASVEFLVTENPKVVEPSKPSVDTGDEIVWIVLATLVSAMAAAVVYNKKRI
ncbi:MAG: hypothetical protein E7665_08395 [Ruminococcaceae bacterium]|nr:hypothetical protein [Oscillospiraceae bacterium]